MPSISSEIALNANGDAKQKSDAPPASKLSPLSSQQNGDVEVTTKTHNEHDCKEQVVALLRAIELLCEISANSSSATSAARQLDELQSTWKLEDTHVPQLLRSIQRLQSFSSLLQQDADGHAVHVQALQHELSETQTRARKLERAVHKLHKKNELLRSKAEQDKKSLVNQVKNYVVKKNEDDQRHQLAAHERLLRIEGSRSRCSSREFSETEEEVSISSSVSSFVTDDGVATVRYSSTCIQDDGQPTTPRCTPQEAHDYDLTFPQGSKIGLQFYKVLMEDDSSQGGILNDAIQASPQADSGVAHSKESPFSMHFKFDSFRGKPHDERHAYLVCGHYGFDRDVNTQPALGARLVKVNGESVGKLTLDKIKAALKCTKREFFTLTFCNETLTPNQREALDNAVHAARRQYEEGETDDVASPLERQANPFIICMHDEGSSRLSSFLSGARSRTFSDNAVRAESNGSGQDEVSKDNGASSSVRGLYSLLHGESRVKLDSDLVNVDHFDIVRCEQQTSSEDAGTRLSSMFSSPRNRTLSDGAMPVDLSASARGEESSNNALTSPSTRGFYSILHGTDGSCNAGSNCDAPRDLVNGDRKASPEASNPMESHGKRLSSMFNTARMRTFSDSSVPDIAGRDHETLTEDDSVAPETPGSHLASLFNGPRENGEVDELSCRDDLASNHKTPDVETVSPPPLALGAPPSQKLKKSMNAVGSKFKSLF